MSYIENVKAHIQIWLCIWAFYVPRAAVYEKLVMDLEYLRSNKIEFLNKFSW